MNRKRTQEAPDPNQTRFEIGEYVTIVPDSPLARSIALITEAAKQRTKRTIPQGPNSEGGKFN